MDNLTPPEIIKLVVIGDSDVGKTSLVNRFVQGTFTPHNSNTVGVDFLGKKLKVFNKNYTVQIWDTAGQERFKSVVRSYFKSASAVLLAFDLTNRISFEHVNSWLLDVQEEMEITAPVVLVGNKSDLVEQRQVSQKVAVAFAKKRNLEYYETSAENADGVDEVFTLTVEKVVKTMMNSGVRSENRSPTIASSDLRQSFGARDSKKEKARKGCCI